MKIYLDLCALQRPLDTKDQPRIAVEAEAVLSVLALFESGQIELVSSETLLFEATRNPNQTRTEYTLEVLRRADQTIELDKKIQKRAREFTEMRIQPLDALHLASAEIAKVAYFCTCDDRFLKAAKSIDKLQTKVVSPTELVEEIDK